MNRRYRELGSRSSGGIRRGDAIYGGVAIGSKVVISDTKRYKRASTMVTGNLDFAEWVEAFPSRPLGSATLDRLRHSANRILTDGDSSCQLKLIAGILRSSYIRPFRKAPMTGIQGLTGDGISVSMPPCSRRAYLSTKPREFHFIPSGLN